MVDQTDEFSKFYPDLDSPARNAFVITPSDTANTSFTTRAVYVGGVGNLTVEMEEADSGTSVLFSAVPAGTTLPIRVRKIRAANTTATLIVGLY